MRIPLKITYNFDLISKLLDKFELDYDKDEVEELIEEVQEEIGLEEFEEDLGSTQNIEIGDFEKLTGYEFEGYLKGLFDLLGYTVIETSLSGDQGADLIASKDGQKTVVQAKKYSGKVANKAIQEISAAQRHYKADKAIVVTNSSFTKSAIDLALSNDVELWDGKKLKDIIRELRSKKKEKHLEAQKAMTLNFKDGEKFVKINIPCPFCEENFDYDLEIGKNSFETSCPNCGSEIASKVNVKSTSRTWSCEFCGKEFDTKEKAEKHEKTCRSRKK
ncbi:restriction endonuclease [Patescibacteria group bacterium]|nr:restriction endonuclease [Patescibacteria group bacterium]